MAKTDVKNDRTDFDNAVAPLSSELRVDSEYCEASDGGFSKIFNNFKKQCAGVVKEYKGKQICHTRTEKRRIKDKNAKKRNFKRAKNFEFRGRRYF